MYEKMDKIIDTILHILEFIIALLTLIVLVGLIGYEVYKAIIDPSSIMDLEEFLHGLLTIVVGLEFVRMLMDLTPENTVDVIIIAISRQIIVDHTNPVSNIVCVVCIASLFAVRKFLMPKLEAKKHSEKKGET